MQTDYFIPSTCHMLINCCYRDPWHEPEDDIIERNALLPVGLYMHTQNWHIKCRLSTIRMTNLFHNKNISVLWLVAYFQVIIS